MNESAHAKARRHLDPVGTRKAILNAAVTEFAQRGYSGTAMGDVADAAGVTKSLVQYHFETKEQLWLTAVASCMQPFIDAVDRFLASEHTVEDAACLLRERFELFQRRPEVVRFLGWMSLEPYPLPPAGVERAPKAWAAIVASMTHAEHRRMILPRRLDAHSRVQKQDPRARPEPARNERGRTEGNRIDPAGPEKRR
jgi:AcrR family transcriptional regulator